MVDPPIRIMGEVVVIDSSKGIPSPAILSARTQCRVRMLGVASSLM